MNSATLASSEKWTEEGEAEEEKEAEEGRGRRKDSAEVNHETTHRGSGTITIIITRFEKHEPRDRCIKREIQTAINVKTCKRYAREYLKLQK